MDKIFTPVSAIRARCLACAEGQASVVRKCVQNDCPLFQYRFGRNPARKGIGGPRRVLIPPTHHKPGLPVATINSSLVVTPDVTQAVAGSVPAVPQSSGPVGGTFHDQLMRFKRIAG
jgi:hypothetical protein